MPNHCYNTLSVTGPKDDLLAFHGAIDFTESEDTGIIRAFVPFPTELNGRDITDKDGKVVGRAFTDEGYSWCLKNWGTKWGDYDTEVRTEPFDTGDDVWSATYSYSTAWSPATEAIGSIALLFPTLTFFNFYEEEGMGFMGNFTAHGSLRSDNYTEELPQYPDRQGKNDDEYVKAEEDYFEAMTELRDRLSV